MFVGEVASFSVLDLMAEININVSSSSRSVSVLMFSASGRVRAVILFFWSERYCSRVVASFDSCSGEETIAPSFWPASASFSAESFWIVYRSLYGVGSVGSAVVQAAKMSVVSDKMLIVMYCFFMMCMG